MADISADDLEKLISDLEDQKRREGDASGALSKAIKSLQKQVEQLGDKADRARKGFQELDSDIKRGRRSILDNAGEIDRLTQLYEDSGQVMDAQTARLRKSLIQQAAFTGGLKGATDALQGVVAAQIDLAINQYKTFYDGLLKGTNAFDMSTKMQVNAIDANLKSTKAVTSGFEDLGGVLTSVLPGYWKILGIAVIGVAKLFGYIADKSADLAKFGVETLNSELQKTITSFGEASHAGVFLANGMSGLKQLANDSGMSIKAFTSTIKNAGPELAMIGGTAGAGAQKLGQVYKAMEPFRRGLLNLGITQEEQLQGTIEYMDMQRRSGTLELKSKEQLAKETDSYMTNLKVISSITGEDAKAAQKRARDAAQQLRTQSILQEMGGEAAGKFDQAVRLFGAGSKNAMGQILEFGDVTDTNTRAALEQQPVLYQLMKDYANDIKNSGVSQDEAMARFNSRLEAAGPEVLAQAKQFGMGVGRANLALGKYGEMVEVGQMGMNLGMKATSKEFGKNVEAVKDQKETTDDLTNTVSSATAEFYKMQAILEDDLLPSLKDFAKISWAIVEQQRDKLSELGIYGAGKAGDVKAAEKERADAYKDAGFWQKWYGVGRTDEQKAADKKLDAARGWDPNQSYDNGGIASGPKTGYNATLHGTEAVVPLPNGRAIPVELDLSGLQRTLNEFVDIAKDQRSLQEQLLRNSL